MEKSLLEKRQEFFCAFAREVLVFEENACVALALLAEEFQKYYNKSEPELRCYGNSSEAQIIIANNPLGIVYYVK